MDVLNKWGEEMSRYIEVDDAASAIYHHFPSIRTMAEARGIIEEAPTIDAVSEWIPCSKRLPSNFSEDETVLATTDVDGDRVIAMFALDVKSFYLKGYVSAWMPLPAPWKGADDE